MRIRLLINGKKAGLEDVRNAIIALRDEGYPIEVRPTWESGDFERLLLEASEQSVDRIIAGGGDGSVNEIADALLKHNIKGMELAILPLGTANDFATACEIPTLDAYQALKLAVTGNSYWIDAALANDRHFINIATAGFGAQVTANTPVALKNFLGGGAYTLSGLVQAIGFQPFEGTINVNGESKNRRIVVGAVCNGRTAGGGQPLSPTAYIDDGLLDAFSLEYFSAKDVPEVIEELKQMSVKEGRFVHRQQVEEIEWISDSIMPINLDGEPISINHMKIKVLPQAVRLVLPANCPALKRCD